MTEPVTGWHDQDAAPEWLRAAQTGGLPEPRRSRWQPLRVGIANLWEYDDAEFWFADGRLVLRGGNGAGKTKVLELTTLLLLRGEISPSVLDPFGSQHRTMRFNLLPTGEGDDPRPAADAGLGYAWVEFGRIDEAGAAQYFVCGLGASARAGSGSVPVTTWHFVTRRRPGRDFKLRVAGRAIDAATLKKIDGISLPPNATAYRARLADELFGLSSESYDNLTELLKQLRKPKLGERLNPASLAAALRDALPPLATHEVDQLADGWERLEQLRLAVQRAEDAATAVASFVKRGWQPWARAVLRTRADEMASATTRLDGTTADKKAAETALVKAGTTLRRANDELDQTKTDYRTTDTALRELLESRSYRDAVAMNTRIEELRRSAASTQQSADATKLRYDREMAAVGRAADKSAESEQKAENARGAVETAAREVTGAAEPAGLAEATTRHLVVRDVTALSGEYRSRTDRFAHLRELFETQRRADLTAELSAQKVESAAGVVDMAAAEGDTALAEARTAASALDDEVRAWSAAARIAPCDDHQLARYGELIAEMTAVDDGVPAHLSVVDELRAHLRGRRQLVADREQRLRMDRKPVADRAAEVESNLTAARNRTEEPPPAPQRWSRRGRPELSAGLGAPLWRLVNPAEQCSGEVLARLEAALAASGLLDAWVRPDGTVDFGDSELGIAVQDGTSTATVTLAAVLEPVAAGGVMPEMVARVLDRFGWCGPGAVERPEGDGFAANGAWRIGPLGGRAEPVGPASYLGAAAQEARRLRQIRELEAEQADLTARLDAFDDEIGTTTAALAQAATEEAALPVRAERALAGAVVRWADRCRGLDLRRAELVEFERKHNADILIRDRARAEFAEYASAHRFRLTDLDAQGTALTHFGTCLERLGTAVQTLALREETSAESRGQLEERKAEAENTAAELTTLTEDARQLQVRVRTAVAAVGTTEREQLDRKTEFEQRREELEVARDRLDTEVAHARTAAQIAETTLHAHERNRAEAEQRRDNAMTALWLAVDDGLGAAITGDPAERRNVASAREFAALVRRDVAEGKDAPDPDRAWRQCLQHLEELRQLLLPQQDARVTDEEEFTLPRVQIHTGAATGFQSPPAAADTLAQQVLDQRAGYDAEQQQVLATLLGSAFIEHLKDRLDYTTRTFTRINDLLVTRPTRQGHAVRVNWVADPTDPDAAAVVDALGRGYGQLSSDRQVMVREFLTRRIETARAEADSDSAADWKQQLTKALDYRSWLKITLQYRPGATNSWAVFDAARHGAKSGGEKVVLLSQPLFAAAVVAYDAAAEHAPRWVWLDEAMSGVDGQVKAQFMGLTVDFELDIMLTAHDEWCTYPSVPAVAVYDLARERHLPGVDVMSYLWCGGTLHHMDVDRLGGDPSEPADLSVGLFALDG
ncbi:TIGR02680 family protein [Nocardia sp. NPDC058666]|uniref:TIGR02680 family protein n=1 Tax=Nocardia sp. NPDC058666 TaxID=3346587 RepID=UPI00364F054E